MKALIDFLICSCVILCPFLGHMVRLGSTPGALGWRQNPHACTPQFKQTIYKWQRCWLLVFQVFQDLDSPSLGSEFRVCKRDALRRDGFLQDDSDAFVMTNLYQQGLADQAVSTDCRVFPGLIPLRCNW